MLYLYLYIHREIWLRGTATLRSTKNAAAACEIQQRNGLEEDACNQLEERSVDPACPKHHTQGVLCLLSMVLNAVSFHIQCSDHDLGDEAPWL